MNQWLMTGFFLIFALAAHAAATNSNWSVHAWQTDDGLPNNNIAGLAQTSDGYLWLATYGHFARFDGVSFEEFPPKSVIPDFPGKVGRVSALLPDHNGGLWLAMVHGPVVHLVSGTAKIYTNDLPDLLAQTLLEDHEGSLWIVYHGNVVCRIKAGKVTSFSTQDGLPARYDCSLTLDDQGRLWFAKDQQIGIFRDEHFETLVRVPSPPARVVSARDGGVWICSSHALFKCNENGKLETIGTFAPEPAGADTSALLEDRNGAVWIGTTGNGLFRYNGSGFERIPTSYSQIACLMEDREGNLWVGTGGGGLDRIEPRAFTLEGTETGLPFETVQSTCEDTDGTVWAITQNLFLVCRTNNAWHVVPVGTNQEESRIRAICVAADPRGGVWVGTQNHVIYHLQNGKTTAWQAGDGLASDVIRCLQADAAGDLWIGEEGPDTVQRLRDGRFTTFNVPRSLGTIRAMARDTNGDIWVGSSKGILLRVHGDAITDETTNMSRTYTSIRTLQTTADGSLWIGYAGWGLARYKDGHFIRMGAAQGLDDEYISQIVADGHGWLWLGGDRGIFKIREQEVDRLAAGQTAKVRSIRYGRDEGLPSLQANYGISPGAMRTRDGQLWIPMRPNLVVINPENLHDNLEPPTVLLKRVELDDKTVAQYGGPIPVQPAIDLEKPEASLTFPPGHRRLEFEFAALSFGAPENVHFQYQLEGFDYGWIEAGMQRTVGYSRLAAGNYRFRVRACNGDGVWNENGVALPFVVTPFFWQTWWFQLASIPAVGLIAILIVRYIITRRLHLRLRALEQESALAKERARIARDIHDDVGGSLTQIKLLFELAQMRRQQPDKIDALGEEGLVATRRIIKSLDEIVWAVNPRNDSLPHLIEYIGQFAVEFLDRANIRCRVDLPPKPPEWDMSPEARHNLFLVVKETLNNIVRHSRAKEVWLRINVVDQFLNISVEDDGCGFAAAPVNGSSDGLKNITQRMQDIGGQSRIESKTGTGTRVFLIFPRQAGK